MVSEWSSKSLKYNSNQKSPGHQLPHLVAVFVSWPTVTSEIDNGLSALRGFAWCDYIEVLLDLHIRRWSPGCYRSVPQAAGIWTRHRRPDRLASARGHPIFATVIDNLTMTNELPTLVIRTPLSTQHAHSSPIGDY